MLQNIPSEFAFGCGVIIPSHFFFEGKQEARVRLHWESWAVRQSLVGMSRFQRSISSLPCWRIVLHLVDYRRTLAAGCYQDVINKGFHLPLPHPCASHSSSTAMGRGHCMEVGLKNFRGWRDCRQLISRAEINAWILNAVWYVFFSCVGLICQHCFATWSSTLRSWVRATRESC